MFKAQKFLGVGEGGRIEIHGKKKLSWTKLDGHLQKGKRCEKKIRLNCVRYVMWQMTRDKFRYYDFADFSEDLVEAEEDSGLVLFEFKPTGEHIRQDITKIDTKFANKHFFLPSQDHSRSEQG